MDDQAALKRRRRFACAGCYSFTIAVYEAIQITDGAALRHHIGAQILGSTATMVCGYIIGWGCGR